MAIVIEHEGLGADQAAIKRTFDLMLSAIGLALSSWLILLAWIAASWDTRSNGFFIQQRVGKNGRLFRVVKIKTMRPNRDLSTTVTRSGDPRITPLGRFLRKTKIDELPQLWNVLWGDMSFVGPRPDVPGFADSLVGEERRLLSIRPGITGPATLKYRNEEELLTAAGDPEVYNREVIWPDKVRINLEYIRNWRLAKDLQYIWKTVMG
ncbi:Sugar transferase involved in LPS biosynthesis (colanic, teichoic acid) [Chromohalobacter canadensis]|uniref:Sugar transferase involved in LPS biosynthesis (Colanic, teichoic acid) n=1 Tax=Chromohalobacter canadensis TaxID=141389 RepID=A0A285VU50_9GAMM|nr:sugar transferase [Chromohalobacter canadensis]SOC57483.1 Sugar transferase involved in LPS biosynthesis (colanic, teichoic acid) [Chromohalobacter canadensis]